MTKEELQAIKEIVTDAVNTSAADTKREIEDTKRQIMTYIELHVERDIKTLAEGIMEINKKISNAETVEHFENRLSTVEHAAEAFRLEIDELKKAQ